MKRFERIEDLQKELINRKEKGEMIGFVPTMGALHQGHLSLLQTSLKENDCSVVSIFVNPTQFNDKSDYEKYPRDVEDDIIKLEECECDIVFIPDEKEIYPEGQSISFDLGGLDETMEGAFRPGHFQGVAQVVARLFDIVKPMNAYFGEKDFQQLAIIKYLVNSLSLGINIVGCPILREPNGLAMSSRNERLSVVEREEASLIYNTLKSAAKISKSASLEMIYSLVSDQIGENKYLDLEYFEIVDSDTLKPVRERVGNNVIACIAVYAGNVRLIDNVRFNF